MTYSSIIIPGSGGSYTDTTPPSTPTGLNATSRCQTTFTLNWSASTDNVGVTGYKVFKNGSLYQDVGNQLFCNVTGQTAGTANNWTVKAYDAASNESSASSALQVTQGITVYSITLNDDPQSTGALACTDNIGTTYYKTTSGSTVQLGDVIYDDSCGTTKTNGGNQYYSDGLSSFQISAAGGVSNFAFCM